MLNKLLAAGFVFLLVGKMFFRPQFQAFQKWFSGVINAMLIAIVLVYLVQGFLWWSQQRSTLLHDQPYLAPVGD